MCSGRSGHERHGFFSLFGSTVPVSATVTADGNANQQMPGQSRGAPSLRSRGRGKPAGQPPRPPDGHRRRPGPRYTDTIALATHGRGGLRRRLLGSVADKVVRGTSAPVLVYRPVAP
jgi:hypothetical protein